MNRNGIAALAVLLIVSDTQSIQNNFAVSLERIVFKRIQTQQPSSMIKMEYIGIHCETSANRILYHCGSILLAATIF